MICAAGRLRASVGFEPRIRGGAVPALPVMAGAIGRPEWLASGTSRGVPRRREYSMGISSDLRFASVQPTVVMRRLSVPHAHTLARPPSRSSDSLSPLERRAHDSYALTMTRPLLKVLAGWLLVMGIGVLFIYLSEEFPDLASTYAEGRLRDGGWTLLAIGVVGLLYSSSKAASRGITRRWGRKNSSRTGRIKHGGG